MLFSRKLGVVWGAKAKPSAPAYQPPGGFACDGSTGVMSGRANWSRIKQRSLMRRRGIEDVKGGTPIVAPLVNKQPPRRKLSKAELREQAAAAFLAWRAGQTSKDK